SLGVISMQSETVFASITLPAPTTFAFKCSPPTPTRCLSANGVSWRPPCFRTNLRFEPNSSHHLEECPMRGRRLRSRRVKKFRPLIPNTIFSDWLAGDGSVIRRDRRTAPAIFFATDEIVGVAKTRVSEAEMIQSATARILSGTNSVRQGHDCVCNGNAH